MWERGQGVWGTKSPRSWRLFVNECTNFDVLEEQISKTVGVQTNGAEKNYGPAKGGHRPMPPLNTRLIEDKLLRRAYRKSPTLFRKVPSPTPYGLLLPRLGVRNPYPKLQSLLSPERVKLRTANLADAFTGSIRTKARETLKGSEGISRDCWKFFEHPYYHTVSQEWAKLRTSNLAGTFIKSIWTKAH